MIISHQHKFIFLKTRKTAGTSIEIALSRFCGASDVITPISAEDELERRELGFREPQNTNVPLRFLSQIDWLRWIRSGQRPRFFNHASARFIRKHVEASIWNGYFKFCFERNPFDKAISRYYYRTREPRPAIADYLEAAPRQFLSNWELYTVNDQLAVNFLGRYENLTEDLAAVSDQLGLDGRLSLPRTKAGFRTNRDHYSKVLDGRARARIECVCAKEITTFDDHWGELQLP